MSTPIVSLAYKSRSTDPVVDRRTLASILTTSQALNVANDLTGALACGDGYFVQVLEGPEAPLMETMARIHADDRHHSLHVVGPTPIDQRQFPDWCMASLVDEPALRPTISLLCGDWETYGARASKMLARVLNDEAD